MIPYFTKWPTQELPLVPATPPKHEPGKRKKAPYLPAVFFDTATYFSTLPRDILGVLSRFVWKDQTKLNTLLDLDAGNVSHRQKLSQLFDATHPFQPSFCSKRVLALEFMQTRKLISGLYLNGNTPQSYHETLLATQKSLTSHFFKKFLKRINFEDIRIGKMSDMECKMTGLFNVYIVTTPIKVAGLENPLTLKISFRKNSIRVMPKELHITLVSATKFEIEPYEQIIELFRIHAYNKTLRKDR